MSRGAAVVIGVLAAWLAAGTAMAQKEPPADPMVTAAQANARLGIEYLKKGEVGLARGKIERALVQNPKDVGVQLAGALLYERLGDDAVAEQHYRQALKVDATSPEAQNAYASFLCRHAKSEQGEAMFLKAAKNPLSRSQEVMLTNAGVCARSGGRPEAAEKHLRAALAIRPTSREALFQMTSLSLDRGAHLQARAFLQRYLATGSAGPDVLLLGVRIEKALGDRQTATEYAERLKREFPDSSQAAELATASGTAR
jgi:type IV pilus assembly protein PilF